MILEMLIERPDAVLTSLGGQGLGGIKVGLSHYGDRWGYLTVFVLG